MKVTYIINLKGVLSCRDKKSSVLVHCKKGISRSSSTVIAYVMKEYGWPLERALQHVKDKRNCITPNSGFMEQLATFHGVLQVWLEYLPVTITYA
jgi:protein-tyrosine phosphatase